MPLNFNNKEYLMVREMVILNLEIKINNFLLNLIISYKGRRAL